MENIRQLLENGITAGIVMAAVLAGFAGFLYLLYRLIKLMRPKEVRQEEQRILSHRFYKVSGRGRVAYLVLCLEKTLQFYKQDFTTWEWLLRKLWSVTDNSENNWIDVWLDSIGELLPKAVLTNSSVISDETCKARNLYIQAGYAMIVINTILESAYTMVSEWSPDTSAHDPGALCYTIGNFISYRTKVSDGSHCGGKETVADAIRRRRRILRSRILCSIDEVEETMKKFEVPRPSDEVIQWLFLEQKSSSFGEPFDGLCFSCVSKGGSKIAK